MKEETRKRLAAFFFVMGVGLCFIALVFYFRFRIWEKALFLLKFRRAPGSWV